MKSELKNRSLSDVKVLDFTGELGPYASKLYAGLGAEVIHLEPITGDPLREKGPFYKDDEGNMEASLQFLYYNGNKKSLVVDLHKEEGKQIFLRLIQDIDIFMESCVPGYLDSLGLSYECLKEINPKLVQISLTSYWPMDPYENHLESDLACSVMGGKLCLVGTDNKKLVRTYDNKASKIAESYLAIKDSIALYTKKIEKGYVNQSVSSFMSNAKCFLENPQLKYRNFWQIIEHENLGKKATYSDTPYEFGDLDWRFSFPAPKFGEHTFQTLKGLKYTKEEIAIFSKQGIIKI